MIGAQATRGGVGYFAPAVILSLLVALVPIIFIFYFSTEGGHSLEPFETIMGSKLFQRAMATTLEVSLEASLISLLLGYTIALHLARQTPKRRAALMVLVLLPFWTSILVKSYAFTIILGREGIINSFLSWVLGEPIAIPLILNRIGVMIGMTNYLTPLIVFPVLASLLTIDPALYRAAEVMGARPVRIFFTITLPLSMPGIVAGFFSVAVMALGFFIVPALLGGRQDAMLANLVDFYTREVLDWNTASAVGVVLFGLVVLLSLPAMVIKRDKRQVA